MTQFKQFELVYNQLKNLTEEINALIEKEEYDSAAEEVVHKDRLIQQLLNIKKTIKFTAEERETLLLMEQEMQENKYANIEVLKKIHHEIGEEIKRTKKKVKVNSAYDEYVPEQQGIFVDMSD